MKGILLISHGPLAEGMLKTAEIFFGENIPQMKAVVLNTQDDPEDFRRPAAGSGQGGRYR